MTFEPPKFEKGAFNCPFCGAFAHMEWYSFMREEIDGGQTESLLHSAQCAHCRKESIWRVWNEAFGGPYGAGIKQQELMIYPEGNTAPVPADDMPEEVRLDYSEAASVPHLTKDSHLTTDDLPLWDETQRHQPLSERLRPGTA